MGAAERRKGANFERAVVRKLNAAFPELGAKRGFQYRDGTEAPDVIAGPMWIECKAHARTNPRAALRSAVSEAPKGHLPVAICKDDNRPITIMMELDDLFELVDELVELRSR